MTDTSLSLPFSLKEDTGNPYWLNMEVVKRDDADGMSVGDKQTGKRDG